MIYDSSRTKCQCRMSYGTATRRSSKIEKQQQKEVWLEEAARRNLVASYICMAATTIIE